ncbi:MAG: PKD domain-containing protein, partial [Actinobacteria bacterium]|nr:PKD domain-containing protein [Actinomycetota bacterium]
PTTTPPPDDNDPPSAAFAAGPTSGPAPLTVGFADLSSDPDGDPLARDWDFGDGSPHLTGAAPSHTYGAPGVYTATLTVTDPGGLSDSAETVITVLVPPPPPDTEPPDTTIDEAPVGAVSSTVAHFEYSSTEPGSTFECSLDGGGFVGCPAAGKTYGSLGQGAHTFAVRATDGAGNTDPTPALAGWVVDTIPPETSIHGGPPDPSADPTPTFAFSSNEPGSTFECSLDGSGFAACESGEPVEVLTAFERGLEAAAAAEGRVLALGDGPHNFHVRAVDVAGNRDPSPASHTWTLDTAGPTTTITDKPTDPSADDMPKFSFEADEPATFECQVDGLGFAPCSSGEEFGPFGHGPHTFQVKAKDDLGNEGPVASYGWEVDLVGPTTNIVSHPSDPSADNTPMFVFSSPDADVAGFECRIDAGPFAACSSGDQFGPLADAPHQFDVQAVDPLGNVGPMASYSWTIDTTVPDTDPPDTVIDSGPDDVTNKTTATFTFHSPDDSEATFECRLDSDQEGDWEACTSAHQVGGGEVEAAALADGDHTFEVRAVDQAGNRDETPALWEWTVDTEAPDTQITSGPIGPTKETTATFTFLSPDDPEADFECRLNSVLEDDFAACTSPHDVPEGEVAVAALADGPYTFEVRAVDQAGNADPVPDAREWTVDTVPPVVEITDGPGGEPGHTVSHRDAVFKFTADDGAEVEVTAGEELTVECRLDGDGDGGWELCPSPKVYPDLDLGPHLFEVRATDAASNQGSDSWAWAIEEEDPEPVNNPPAMTGPKKQHNVDEGESNEDDPIVLKATDPDGDDVTFVAVTEPALGTLVPDPDDWDTELDVSCDEAEEEVDVEGLVWTCTAEVVFIAPDSVSRNETVDFKVKAVDEHGLESNELPVKLTVKNKPGGGPTPTPSASVSAPSGGKVKSTEERERRVKESRPEPRPQSAPPAPRERKERRPRSERSGDEGLIGSAPVVAVIHRRWHRRHASRDRRPPEYHRPR